MFAATSRWTACARASTRIFSASRTSPRAFPEASGARFSTTTRYASTGWSQNQKIPARLRRRRPDGRADDEEARLARLGRCAATTSCRSAQRGLGRRCGRRTSSRSICRRMRQSNEVRCCERDGRRRLKVSTISSLARRGRLLDHSGRRCRAHAARLARRPAAAGWTRRCPAARAAAAGTLTVMAGGEAADLERLAPLMRDISPALHAHGAGRRRPRREDDQPAHRRRRPCHARRGGRAVRESRHRRRAHARMPRRRLRRQQRAEGLLAAHGSSATSRRAATCASC